MSYYGKVVESNELHMMTSDELIRNICAAEEQTDCYCHTINGIAIYNYVQRYFRKQKCREFGFISKEKPNHVSGKKKTKTIIKSTCQLLLLLLVKKKRKNAVFSFPRVDKVNGLFLDKFTDPIIDNTKLKEQGCFIFERGMYYVHSQPRYHSKDIVYCDAIDYYSKIIAKITLPRFIRKYNSVFQGLWLSIEAAFPDVSYNKKITAQTILQSYISTMFYGHVFKRLSVVNLFAPARAAFSLLIPAAKQTGVKVFEIQHGITYGESVTYSGYRDSMFTPDYFLSFGDNKPLNVYGISIEKIIPVGFAFFEYLKNNTSESDKKKSYYDVLVVSEPHQTSAILSAICQLAKNNQTVIFHFRPHPEEYFTDEQKKMMDAVPNIVLDDNRQNIMVVLNGFLHVVGENSTVLYEALGMGKKVGRLCMEGLCPRYMEETDEKSFWQIYNQTDFEKFMDGRIEDKVIKHIYSPFRQELFDTLL